MDNPYCSCKLTGAAARTLSRRPRPTSQATPPRPTSTGSLAALPRCPPSPRVIGTWIGSRRISGPKQRRSGPGGAGRSLRTWTRFQSRRADTTGSRCVSQDASGAITGGKSLLAFYAVTKDDYFQQAGSMVVEPLAVCPPDAMIPPSRHPMRPCNETALQACNGAARQTCTASLLCSLGLSGGSGGVHPGRVGAPGALQTRSRPDQVRHIAALPLPCASTADVA